MSSPLQLTCLVPLLCVTLALGCQIDEPKLKRWGSDKREHDRIAAFAIEFDRPLELRKVALREITFNRRYNLIMTMFTQVGERKDDAEAKLKQLSNELISVIDETLKLSAVTPEEEVRAAELAYFLMNVNATRAEFAQHPELLKSLTTWSLPYLRSEDRKVISPVSGVDALVDPSQLLKAILYTAEGGGDALLSEVFKVVVDDLNAHLEVDYAMRLHKVVDSLKNKEISKDFAHLWLKVIKLAYQKQPQALTPEVLNAAQENGNLTLVRLLIELGRDQEGVENVKALTQSIRQSLDRYRGSPHLKLLRESIVRMISSERASAELIFNGLYWSWTLGEQDDLKTLLMSIPAEFKVPVLGSELRGYVNQVCADISGVDRDSLYAQLEESLVSLKPHRELWLARLITVVCLDQLYPDNDTVKTLLKKHRMLKMYRKDQRQILAWEPDRETTLGEIVNRYVSK